MNILVDEFPDFVEIDGVDYKINTDFRASLRTLLAFEDNDLALYEKQIIMLQNLYNSLPPNIEEAANQAIRFLNGGLNADIEEQGVERLYSFSKDANYIFAAFRQTHGIDLETQDMHWWKFLALFMDLGGETTWANIISLRKRLRDGTATEEEKKMAFELSDILDLPKIDDRTLEEREMHEEFMRLIAGNGNI